MAGKRLLEWRKMRKKTKEMEHNEGGEIGDCCNGGEAENVLI